MLKSNIKNKKGVELSVNTMIVIVLALIVLIVAVYLVMKGTGNFTDNTGCEKRGGICETLTKGQSCSDVQGGAYPLPGAWSCTTKEQTCCTKIG